MDLLCICWINPVRQSPGTTVYGCFTHRTVTPRRPGSSGPLPLSNPLRRLPSLTHFRHRLLGCAVFTAFLVLHSRPSTDRASCTLSLSLIGLLTLVPPRDSASPPEVTRCSSVSCRPQTPWCGGLMRTPSPPYCRLDLAPPLADQFIVGVAPIDYGPILLLKPFGFHL